MSTKSHLKAAEVLSPIPRKGLITLYLADHRDEDHRSVQKIKTESLQDSILAAIDRASEKALAENLSIPQMTLLLANVDLDRNKRNNNPKSKRVLYKRLLESLQSDGIKNFLKENAEVPLLQEICELCDLPTDSEDTETMVDLIVAELEAFGLEMYFHSFDQKLLAEVCFEMGLVDDVKDATSQANCANAILHNTPVEVKQKKKAPAKQKENKEPNKGESKKEETKKKRKAKATKDTTTKEKTTKRSSRKTKNDDEEEEDAKSASKKKVTAEDKPKKGAKAPAKEEPIFSDSEEDEEEQPKPKAKAEPRKKEGHKEEEKKDKQEKKNEEQPAKDNFDPNDIDNLDLDRLADYNEETLIRYCKEEGIPFKFGETSNGYIQAILDYNDAPSDEEVEVL